MSIISNIKGLIGWKQERKQLINEYEKVIASLKDENGQLMRLNDKSSATIQKMTKDKNVLSKSLELASNEVVTLKKDKLEKQNKITHLMSSLSSAKDALCTKEAKTEDLENEIKNLNSRIEEIQNSSKLKLEQSENNSKKKLEEQELYYNQKIQILREEYLSEIDKKSTEYINEIGRLKSKYEEDIKNKEALYTSEKKQLEDDYRDNLSNKDAEFAKKLEEQEDKKLQEIESIKEEYEAYKRESEEKIISITADIEKEKNSFIEELKKEHEFNLQLEKKNQEHLNEIEELKLGNASQISELEIQIESLQKQLQEYKDKENSSISRNLESIKENTEEKRNDSEKQIEDVVIVEKEQINNNVEVDTSISEKLGGVQDYKKEQGENIENPAENVGTFNNQVNNNIEREGDFEEDSNQESSNDIINNEDGEENVDSEGNELVPKDGKWHKKSDIDDGNVIDDDEFPYIDINDNAAYDDVLVQAQQLSIPSVYDTKEGKLIDSKDFFKQDENELILWRRNLQEGYLIGDNRLICSECKQPVKISGHKFRRGRVAYFAHFKDSNECPYKTGTRRTKEEIERIKYGLVQESQRHKYLKARIKAALEGKNSKLKGVENVECEKRINSDIPYLNWRRPDVYAEYNGRRFIFELQLTTTFISTIVDRDIFYRLNNYNIVWVFNFDDNQEYVNLHNLMCKDIYYANKRNVFIFDKEAQKKSIEQEELVLKCRWLNANGDWDKDEFVTLDMFKYDEESGKPYIYDADKGYLENKPDLIAHRKQLEHTREFILNSLMEKQKREEENLRRKEEEIDEVKQLLLNTDQKVQLFKDGTKYGYKYNGKRIIPAKYTSAEEIQSNGFAQVGFNRRIGLVRKDGVEVIPVEYNRIIVVNEKYPIIIAIASDSIYVWLGEHKYRLYGTYNNRDYSIILNEISVSEKEYLIKHNRWSGDRKILIYEYEEFCVVCFNQIVYTMTINDNIHIPSEKYSDIKSVWLDSIFAVKDKESDLWKLIGIDGNEISQREYASLIPTGTEFLISKYNEEENKYGVIDYNGVEYFEPCFEKLIFLTIERFAYYEDSLWGICDQFGNIICSPRFTYIKGTETGDIKASTLRYHKWHWDIVNGLPKYDVEDEKLCILDNAGDFKYSVKKLGNYEIRQSGDLYAILGLNNDYFFNYVSPVSDSMLIVSNVEGCVGFIKDGEQFIISDCIKIENLYDDVFIFENRNGYVAIGNSDGPVCGYVYKEINLLAERTIIAKTSTSKLCVIDVKGEEISNEYDMIGDFQDGIADATYRGRKGKINLQGEMQEYYISSEGEYSIFEKFEYKYFKNKEGEKVSDEFTQIDHLYGSYYLIKQYYHDSLYIYDLSTNRISRNSFDSISHLCDDLFVIQNSDNKLLYSGVNLINNNNFSNIELLENGIIVGYRGDKCRLIKKDGEFLSSRVFDSIIEYDSTFFHLKIGENEGRIDVNGNEIIERQEFTENLVLLRRFEDFGLEDIYGNTLIKLDDHYSEIIKIDENHLKIKKGNKFAIFIVCDNILSEEYDSISDFNEGFAEAIFKGRTGRIDICGNMQETLIGTYDEFYVYEKFEYKYLKDKNGEITSREFESVEHLYGPYFKVKVINYKLLIYNAIENKTSSHTFDKFVHLSEDLFAIEVVGFESFLRRETYFILLKGIEVINNTRFSKLATLENGYIVGFLGNKRKLIKRDGSFVSETQFDSIEESTDSYFSVKNNGLLGKIDLEGNVMIEKSDFIDGLILLRRFGDCGLEDTNGNNIISLDNHYTNICNLDNNYLKVLLGDKYALFRITGEKLTDFKYTELESENGSVFATRNKRREKLDANGSEIVHKQMVNGGAICNAFGEYYVVNDSDEIVIPVKYKKIRLVGKSGILALCNNNNMSLYKMPNIESKQKFTTIKDIGHGYYIVMKKICVKIKEKIGWYNNWGRYIQSTKIRKKYEKRYGIVNDKLELVVDCRYKSISDFDKELNIKFLDFNDKNKVVNLEELSKLEEVNLVEGTQYEMVVDSHHPVGLNVRFKEYVFLIYKTFMRKKIEEYKVGENISVVYKGKDYKGNREWRIVE